LASTSSLLPNKKATLPSFVRLPFCCRKNIVGFGKRQTTSVGMSEITITIAFKNIAKSFPFFEHLDDWLLRKELARYFPGRRPEDVGNPDGTVGAWSDRSCFGRPGKLGLTTIRSPRGSREKSGEGEATLVFNVFSC
jgi:hypothetical protein